MGSRAPFKQPKRGITPNHRTRVRRPLHLYGTLVMSAIGHTFASSLALVWDASNVCHRTHACIDPCTCVGRSSLVAAGRTDNMHPGRARRPVQLARLWSTHTQAATRNRGRFGRFLETMRGQRPTIGHWRQRFGLASHTPVCGTPVMSAGCGGEASPGGPDAGCGWWSLCWWSLSYVYGRAGARTAMYITCCAARETFGDHAGNNAQPLDCDRGAGGPYADPAHTAWAADAAGPVESSHGVALLEIFPLALPHERTGPASLCRVESRWPVSFSHARHGQSHSLARMSWSWNIHYVCSRSTASACLLWPGGASGANVYR